MIDENDRREEQDLLGKDDVYLRRRGAHDSNGESIGRSGGGKGQDESVLWRELATRGVMFGCVEIALIRQANFSLFSLPLTLSLKSTRMLRFLEKMQIVGTCHQNHTKPTKNIKNLPFSIMQNVYIVADFIGWPLK